MAQKLLENYLLCPWKCSIFFYVEVKPGRDVRTLGILEFVFTRILLKIHLKTYTILLRLMASFFCEPCININVYLTVGYVCECATGRDHARGHRPDDSVPVVAGEEFFPCETGATTAGSDVTHEAPVRTLRDYSEAMLEFNGPFRTIHASLLPETRVMHLRLFCLFVCLSVQSCKKLLL